MKTITKIITTIILLIGCKSEVCLLEKEVVCVIDGTDTSIHKPTFSEIKPFLNLKNNNNGMAFKAKVIQDIDFGSSFEKSLLPKEIKDETAEERFLRKKKFLKDAEAGYTKISSQATEKQHSIIYRVIAIELKKLSLSAAIDKIMLVTSDLMENSDVLNFYKSHDRYLLLKDPYEVKRKLLNQIELKDLKGVKVYFLFQPKDFYENETYKAILEIYERMITKAGGECYTGFPLDK